MIISPTRAYLRNLLILPSQKLTTTNPNNPIPNPLKYSPADDYQITSFLGKGSTSRVYQGQVIIKLFKDIIPHEKILRQIRVNQLISTSKHVIPLVDVIRDQGCGGYGLIFQNLHGVPLTQLGGNIDFMTALKYTKNILQAIQFCHRNHVVHRDLKKSNILITKTGAKLFDFGLAYIEGVHDFVTKRFGTKGYYTPEVMFKTPRFSRKIDIWVCGVIMAQLLAQKKFLMPYFSDQESARQIVHYSGYDESIVNNISLRTMKRASYYKILDGHYPDTNIIKSAAQTIQKMTSINPEHRPQASQILQYDIFKNIADTC